MAAAEGVRIKGDDYAQKMQEPARDTVSDEWCLAPSSLAP